MEKILVAGAGKVGSLVAGLLADCGDYQVVLADQDFNHSQVADLSPQVEMICFTGDVTKPAVFAALVAEHRFCAVISCLPFFLNVVLAELALQHSVHYFDLTEDTTVTSEIKRLSRDADVAFIPQCGLAPGFVSIVANRLMQNFRRIDEVKLRVGALPQHVSNDLGYAITWSTDGLINQCGNPCPAIQGGKPTWLEPLSGLESVQIEGDVYEAFNTSGGVGSLAELWADRVNTLSYKTLRYPGHCEKMRFLMQGLKLNGDRETLKRLFENAIPKTDADVIVFYVSVSGENEAGYYEQTFVKKLYPGERLGRSWSAIQLTTASACCTVVDLFLQGARGKGFIHQEAYALEAFLQNRFAVCYR